MAAPTIVGVGTGNAGLTSTVTYALPTGYAAGDWLYLVVETSDTAGMAAPSGWAHITNSPKAQGSNVTALNVYRLLATSGSETDPTVPASTNHQSGFAFAVNGADSSGALDFVSTDGSAASTSFSFTGGTTTGADRLVLNVATSSIDQATDPFGTATNSSLAGFGVVGFNGTANGNGGGVKAWSGTLASAGTVAATTGTCTSTARAVLTFAIPPGLRWSTRRSMSAQTLAAWLSCAHPPSKESSWPSTASPRASRPSLPLRRRR
jgi:hypothetical protein